jgi:hypothetical protein
MGVLPAGSGSGASKEMKEGIAKRSIDVRQIEVVRWGAIVRELGCVGRLYVVWLNQYQGLALLLYMKVGPTDAAPAQVSRSGS